MERLGIKDSFNKAMTYSKNAGEYVVDKAKEVSQSQIFLDAKEKITQVASEVKDSAYNMVKSTTGNNENSINNNNSSQNNIQP